MHLDLDGPDDVTAHGLVLDEDRGSLPYSLVHGEALVAAAAWALGEAGVVAVDLTVPWAALREAGEDGEPLVLHDSLCPMTPPDFLARCLATAVAEDAVVVGVRPVTDTVKRVADGVVGDTVDREQLVTVCSPVVLPGRVVAGLDALPTTDLAALVAALGRSGDGADGERVVRLEAPSAARRVAGPDDVRLLEALTQPGGDL